MVQVQRLRDLPGSTVAALKYLSSSTSYRGSRGDLARAKRYYTETGENTYVRNAYDEALLIYGKEKLYRSAKRGLWTYPGWRVDVSKALRSSTQKDLESAKGKLDREQELDDALGNGIRSRLGALKSYFLNISGPTWLVIIFPYFLHVGSDAPSGALLLCALANTYVY